MKAIGLVSGGLDSMLAIRLIQEQGIDVIGFSLSSPFWDSSQLKKKFKIPVKIVKCPKYLNMIKKPKHGYGSAMNPCIDCKIFILKEAKKYAKKVGAKFIFTGEVLGQRPMSQHKKALMLIEKEAGLKGKLLRPLSAKLLPETEAEKKGWVDKDKLLDISGRTRKVQLNLAKKYKLKGFSTPAGGCLLAEKEFAIRLKDLFKHKKRINEKEVNLLRFGRHFRFGDNKIIVGRNESENKGLVKLKGKGDYVFEAQKCGSPITLLKGKKYKKIIKIAADLTAAYSNSKYKEVFVQYRTSKGFKKLKVKKKDKKKFYKTLLN